MQNQNRDPIDNMEKCYNYKEQSERLKKAMEEKFYLEAIFIEYAMIEDRTDSALKHVGKSLDKNGISRKLDDKLNILESSEPFTDDFCRERLSIKFLEDIRKWKSDRNALIHNLMNDHLTTEKLEKTAADGQELLRILKNKVASINRHNDKIRENKNEQ